MRKYRKAIESCGKWMGHKYCGEYCDIVEKITYCSECFQKKEGLKSDKKKS